MQLLSLCLLWLVMVRRFEGPPRGAGVFTFGQSNIMLPEK